MPDTVEPHGETTSLRLRQLRIRSLHRSQRRRQQSSRHIAMNITLLGILLLGIIMPLGLSAGYLIQSYQTLHALGGHAIDGINQLQKVKALLSSHSASNPTETQQQSKLLDVTKLQQAKQDLATAQLDFQQVQHILNNNTSWVQSAAQTLPSIVTYMNTARAASTIGIDLASVGQNLVDAGLTLAPHLQGSLLATGNTPLLTKSDLQMLASTIQRTLPQLEDMQAQAANLSLDALPISAATKKQLTSYLQMLPQIISAMKTASGMVDEFGWLMGIDQTRTFLIQPLDRAEIRATGGFTGQYGELHITGGRVGNFSLQNVALIEYTDSNPTIGNQVPEQYRSWWPFANWGLRDANLSPDFPTSAQYEMQLYKLELGHAVDGVVQFTPVMIEHVLAAIGPVQVPRYQETVTAQNLEEKLHYYQLSHDGIVKEKNIEHVTDDEQARKMFTSELAHILMDHIRKTSASELFTLSKLMFKDMQTRDLQVYVNNPQLEAFLASYNEAGAIDHSTQRDGLYIVQTNVSVNKATEFIKTHFTDNVTLKNDGSASHQLTMNFDYSQSGPIYGFDTYRDYLRIYVPTGAHLITGSGFDSGAALCGGPLQACPQDHVYPNDQLSCPSGQYDGGYANPMLNDPYAGEDHPLDKLGPPTSTSSDFAGRAMFGGYIVIPRGCRLTVTLSWSVPPTQQNNSDYHLFVQRQAGTNPQFELTIQPPACSTTKEQQHFSSNMTEDVQYTIKRTCRG